MVASAEQVGAASESMPVVPRARRRPSPGTVIVLVLLAVALLAWGGWTAVSSAATSGVRIGYDAQPMVCEGSEVGVVPSTDNPELRQVQVDLTPGMRCELRVQVLNDGWSDVTVTTVRLLGLAPGNPLGLELATVNPNGQAVSGDGEDALADIADGIPVPAGTSTTLTALIDYPGGADMDACSSTGWNPPVVTVTAWGSSRELQPPESDSIWFREGSDTACS